MDTRTWILLAFLLVYVLLFIKYCSFLSKDAVSSFNWPKFIARIAIFGAISTILYVVPIFQVKLIFLPSFLELHFDEIPAFIAGFAYGPLTAFMVLLIKTLIKLPFSSTLLVGELSDLIYSTAFVIPASLIYKKMRNMKGVAIGFSVSLVLQLIVSSLINIYVMLPFYMSLYGMSYDGLLALCQAANPAIQNLYGDYVLFVNLPLNLIKDGIVIAVTFLVYRSIHKLLHFDKPIGTKKA
ncbi:MAG: ECF transporter S component [Bacilli bacterium]|jgi:riboflavin transporter FmnP|nr:ECF transporter S component [Bacilli bacterium]MCH4210939.1 ECF transporter S component [Bacilli bacterium]MCI2054987.1 ECF transporter S component [Bacilli bacterium]